jgi:transposase
VTNNNLDERDELKTLISGGKHPVRKLTRAQILLAADAGATDEKVAISVGVGGSTVYRTKRRFVLGNLEAALSEEQRPGASRKLSGEEEALLVATACSGPPAGRARWTLELLADELVRLTEHPSVSRETVRRRLAENQLKPVSTLDRLATEDDRGDARYKGKGSGMTIGPGRSNSLTIC